MRESDMTSPEEIVRNAEAIYQARDLEAAVALFEPDAVIVWNGREVARGIDAVRAFHERFFDPGLRDVQLKKKLIAASDNAIAVEWHATWENPDGTRAEQTAAEHWDMKGERLTEWRAFAVTKRISG
jgi:uncharacterized protein (TIGR02246 family)